MALKILREMYGDLPRLSEALARFEAEVRDREIQFGAERIREACGPCDGRGYNPECHTETRFDETGEPHDVEVVESFECEYCGRPIAALRGGGSRSEEGGGR